MHNLDRYKRIFRRFLAEGKLAPSEGVHDENTATSTENFTDNKQLHDANLRKIVTMEGSKNYQIMKSIFIVYIFHIIHITY